MAKYYRISSSCEPSEIGVHTGSQVKITEEGFTDKAMYRKVFGLHRVELGVHV